MKVVVTGATGFVGKWLVSQLLEQQDQVAIIIRDKSRIPQEWKKKVYIVEEDLQRLEYLSSDDFCDCREGIFFHLGWAGTSGEMRMNVAQQMENVRITCEAVKLAKRLKCTRFVYAGSIMEYEAMEYIPTDGSVPAMGNIYSVMKLTADFCAKILSTQENIDYINVVISNIYGAGEYSSRFINRTLLKMIKNETIPLTHGNQLYDFIYVSDAVKAIIIAAKFGEKNSVYYVGNEKQYTLKSYVLQMRELLESESQLLFGAIPYNGPMLTYKEFETEKIGQLGFVPSVSFAEGIKYTQTWLTEEKCEYIF